MIFTITFIFFLLGLIVGSFLNVVIYRYNTSKSLGGRSACMSCQSKLSWYELVPLFSYLALLGRCRNCKTRISVQYPIVELVTGVIFAALFLKFQEVLFLDASVFAGTYTFYAILFSLLIVIAGYDIRHKIIPDSLSFSFGILAFFGLFFFSTSNISGGFGTSPFFFHVPSLLEMFTGIIVALPFALLWLVSRGSWMGLGDAKLILGLGWMLGLSSALSAIMISFWIGAIIGIVLMVVSKKYKMKSEIPFAPYLILGTLLVFFLPSLFSFLVF